MNDRELGWLETKWSPGALDLSLSLLVVFVTWASSVIAESQYLFLEKWPWQYWPVVGICYFGLFWVICSPQCQCRGPLWVAGIGLTQFYSLRIHTGPRPAPPTRTVSFSRHWLPSVGKLLGFTSSLRSIWCVLTPLHEGLCVLHNLPNCAKLLWPWTTGSI